MRLQNIYLPSQAARLAWLAQHLPQLPGSGIIYALTVRDAQRVADWLKTQNINAKAYYGDVDPEIRIGLEDELLNNKIKVLVATTALGMGFDKPDLGFVIHYQRPGSVVHYYQQVGRAGRAVETAYGILLSGDEDDEITNYFINTAFPPQRHTEEVLAVINSAENGISVNQIEQQINLSQGQINKVLKLLSLEFPTPVTKRNTNWYANPVNYQIDHQKIAEITQIRRNEQQRMADYMQSQKCLMAFLAAELDDPNPAECGKCAVCLSKPLLPENFSDELVNQAILYLRRSNQIIEPRKKWIKESLTNYGFSGNIKENLRAEEGRILSLWGDAGWGELVKKGKYRDNHFDDALVQATFEMIQRWKPQAFPTWVTCVPSLNRPELVPDFAKRLAEKLGLPFKPVVRKIRPTLLQKQMNNSYQQAHNLDGSFAIDYWEGMSGNVFLIDDIVDSRWTFTVIAALLRNARSGLVYPVALALNSLGQSD